MNIPEKISMREVLHGHGANGMALYGYEDTAGLGIRMEARRKDRKSPFVETFFLDALPGREFKTFADLCAAALPLTDADIEAATSAMYPRIKSIEPDTCGNRCRLCPRPESLFDAAGERIKHDTWRVEIADSWKKIDSISLCNAHMTQYDGDAKGLRAAMDAEVAERVKRLDERVAKMTGGA